MGQTKEAVEPARGAAQTAAGQAGGEPKKKGRRNVCPVGAGSVEGLTDRPCGLSRDVCREERATEEPREHRYRRVNNGRGTPREQPDAGLEDC